MSNTFVYSDPHFGHQGVCKFTKSDGITPLRPWDTAEEMDEAMVKLYNDVVRPKDKIYFLGDVVIARRHLATLSRLNGDKVLVKGNHDIFKLDEYTKYFRDIRSYQIMNNIVMSHIPIHDSSKGRFSGNIHGHMHSNSLPDPWYLCVCVEQTGFKPIPLEEAYKKLHEQQNDVQFNSDGV